MKWNEVESQRDQQGNKTALSLAATAISHNGCDCEDEDIGTCLACRCEAALKELWEQTEVLKKDLAEAQELVASQQSRYLNIMGKIGEALESVRSYRETGEPAFADHVEIRRLIEERNEARREWCKALAGVDSREAREWAERSWGSAEAYRLFPPHLSPAYPPGTRYGLIRRDNLREKEKC